MHTARTLQKEGQYISQRALQGLAKNFRGELIIQTISNDGGAPVGRHYEAHAYSLSWLSDAVIDLIAEYASSRPSPFSEVLIQHVHGAASQVNPTASAFALWARSFQKSLQSFVASGVYINSLGEEGEEQVRAAYRGNYTR